MWQNQFKLAWRHLLKHRLFTAIKLTGLTAGLAACLLVGLYLHHEWNYDACHLLADRIVKVNMEYNFSGETVRTQMTGNKVGPSFERDFPEVEAFLRVMDARVVVKYGSILLEEERFFFADSTFFEMFTFPLLKGAPNTVLNAPDQVVLSESTARRYFGDADPMGKVLGIGTSREVTVTGIMADPPANTHLRPDFVCSFVSLGQARPENETWWNANYATYLLLKHPDGLAPLQARMTPYMATKSSETGLTGQSYLTFHIEKLRDLHLRSAVSGHFEPNGDQRYLSMLGFAALFILLIGCTTYVNLATAAGMERAKETGICKVLGAARPQLVGQHLSEAFLLTFGSLAAAWAAALALLPAFNSLFDTVLAPVPLFSPALLALFIGFGLAVSLLAGLYPAVVVSRFTPVSVMKGQIRHGQSGAWLRKSLVTGQFAISILLIISTLLLREQLQFVQHKKLGFDQEQVIALPADGKINEQYETLKKQLLQQTHVRSVSTGYDLPTHIMGGYNIGKTSDEQDDRPVTALPAGLDFLETLGMQLAIGSDFTPADLETAQLARRDSTLRMPVLLNEAQVRSFGWSLEEALLRPIVFNGGAAVVKGVVRDFHFRSLHEPIAPLVIFPDTWGRFVLVKLAGTHTEAGILQVGSIWQALVPHRPFSYRFLDEELALMYQAERRTARIVSAFSWLAIILACLGLFGLASFNFSQRTKEVGVRKVLGASTAGIVALLSKDFLLLVFIAFFVAAPLAWFLMEKWLEGFAYRIDMPWKVFAVAGITAVAVAFLTVSFQSVKAALANPVKSLRSE